MNKYMHIYIYRYSSWVGLHMYVPTCVCVCVGISPQEKNMLVADQHSVLWLIHQLLLGSILWGQINHALQPGPALHTHKATHRQLLIEGTPFRHRTLFVFIFDCWEARCRLQIPMLQDHTSHESYDNLGHVLWRFWFNSCPVGSFLRGIEDVREALIER